MMLKKARMSMRMRVKVGLNFKNNRKGGREQIAGGVLSGAEQ